MRGEWDGDLREKRPNLKAEAVSLPLHEQKIVDDLDLAKRASSETGFLHSENVIRLVATPLSAPVCLTGALSCVLGARVHEPVL